MTDSPRRAAATCFAASCASVFERPTTNVSKVRRGSSGDPPSASCAAETGAAKARASLAFSLMSRKSRGDEVSSGPFGLAVAAIAISIGEEIAFRGALYAALEDVGGAPVAIFGTTVLWTAAHALSHPPAFLGAVFAAGLLLALWRWACRDLVGPIVGHVLADLAL